MEGFLSNLKLTGSAGLNFLVAIAALLLAAKLADLFITRILKRIAGRTSFELDDRILEILHQPVRWGVLLIGTAHALVLLSLNDVLAFRIRAALYTVFVFVLAIAVARLATLLIDRSFN